MKWTNLKARDLHKIVRKLNLEERKSKRAGHPTFWYYLDGKKHHMVKFPNIHGGSGSVSPGFIGKIRNQLNLTSSQLTDLVECPLSAEDYKEIVRGKS